MCSEHNQDMSHVGQHLRTEGRNYKTTIFNILNIFEACTKNTMLIEIDDKDVQQTIRSMKQIKISQYLFITLLSFAVKIFS